MKISFLIVVTLIMLLVVLVTTAQTVDTSLKTLYNQQTIYLVGNKYFKNGEKKKSGIFFQKLKKEFVNVSPDTEMEISLAVKNAKIANICSGTALILVYGGLFTLATLPEAVSLGAMTGGLVFLVPTIIYGISSQRHLAKSVWLCNRDILTK